MTEQESCPARARGQVQGKISQAAKTRVKMTNRGGKPLVFVQHALCLPGHGFFYILSSESSIFCYGLWLSLAAFSSGILMPESDPKCAAVVVSLLPRTQCAPF